MPQFTNDAVISIDSTDVPAVLGEGSNNEGVRGVSTAHMGQ